MKKPSKLLTFFTALVTVLFSLSAAVAVPILWRGWYAIQMGSLRLSETTGFTPEVILGAFNEVMDFLVKGTPFGTGELLWSESGRAHFADCRWLFRLDFILLAVTGVILLVILIRAFCSPHFYTRFPVSPPLLALVFTAVVLLVLGVWALVDFDSLFTAFHALCFPGKTNWIFDYHTDQIILILPEVFWARTAGLAAGVTLVLEACLTLLWALLRRAKEPKNVYEQIKDMD